MSRELQLHLDAGGGWIASLALLAGAARIVLITLARGAEQRQVRLDLDKKRFIDRLPDAASEDLADQIARQIRAAA